MRVRVRGRVRARVTTKLPSTKLPLAAADRGEPGYGLGVRFKGFTSRD